MKVVTWTSGVLGAGAQCVLVDDPPNRAVQITAEFMVSNAMTASITNRESRRPHARTLRVSKYGQTLHLREAAARRLESVMRVHQVQDVGMPFWPAAVRWADRGSRPVSGLLYYVRAADGSQDELYETEPGWPQADALVMPVMLGRMTSARQSWTHDGAVLVPVEFTEDCRAEFALRPAASVWANGPAPSIHWTTSPKLCPVVPHFADVSRDYTVTIQVGRPEIARAASRQVYSQANAIEQDHDFSSFGQAEWAKALRFWLDHGSTKGFWIAGHTSVLRLVGDIAGGATVLTGTDNDDVTVGDWIAITDGREILQTAQVTAKSGVAPWTITLGTAVGPHTATSVVVARLILCRFATPAIVLRWDGDAHATSRLGIREIQPELSPAADEVLNQTIGEGKLRGYLYEFTYQAGPTQIVERYTTFEETITYLGNTYTTSDSLRADLAHGEIRTGMALDQDQVTISGNIQALPLLRKLATRSLGSPVTLVIREVDLTDTTPGRAFSSGFSTGFA